MQGKERRQKWLNEKFRVYISLYLSIDCFNNEGLFVLSELKQINTNPSLCFEYPGTTECDIFMLWDSFHAEITHSDLPCAYVVRINGIKNHVAKWFWLINETDTTPSNLFWWQNTVYSKKYAHGVVVLCFVVVMQSFIMNSHELFIHIHQGCFAGTGAIVRLPQCQWSKPDGYGKISKCINTTKHSQAKIVCIFLGMYCMLQRIPLIPHVIQSTQLHDKLLIKLEYISVKKCAIYHISKCIIFLLISVFFIFNHFVIFSYSKSAILYDIKVIFAQTSRECYQSYFIHE